MMNLTALQKLNEAVHPNAKQHLFAVVKAAEFLIEKGPIVCPQKVGKCYSYHKNTHNAVMTSSEIYDILNKHQFDSGVCPRESISH